MDTCPLWDLRPFRVNYNLGNSNYTPGNSKASLAANASDIAHMEQKCGFIMLSISPLIGLYLALRSLRTVLDKEPRNPSKQVVITQLMVVVMQILGMIVLGLAVPFLYKQQRKTTTVTIVDGFGPWIDLYNPAYDPSKSWLDCFDVKTPTSENGFWDIRWPLTTNSIASQLSFT